VSGYLRVVGALALLGGWLMPAGTAWSSEYADGWGPAVGSKLPVLEAPDQTGRVRTLEDLTGEQGILLFLNRSADW
jgi:hypothetical protein